MRRPGVHFDCPEAGRSKGTNRKLCDWWRNIRSCREKDSRVGGPGCRLSVGDRFWLCRNGLLPMLHSALLLWAPNVRKRWMRIMSRILGVAAIVPGLIMLPAVFLGFLLAMGNPPTATRIVRSQDGQEAEVSYDAGFLGRDYTHVALKFTGCCRHVTAFWHGGPSSLDDVNVEWLDNRHLRLRYHVRSGDQQHCEQRVGDVTIVCESLGWP
jgi:hypothetical protein